MARGSPHRLLISTLVFTLVFTLIAPLSGCNAPPQRVGDGATLEAAPRLDAAEADLTARDQGPPPDHPPPDALPWASLGGQVVDQTGQPLVGAAVTACSGVCWPASTDAQGAFRFDALPPGTLALDVRHGPGMSPSLAVVVFAVTLAPAQQLTLPAPVGLPVVGAATPLTGGAQAVAIDAELTLITDAAALTLPFGVNSPYLAGVRVPPAYWPSHALVHGGQAHQALAMWALLPFDARALPPVGVSIESSLGLSAGDRAQLFVVTAKTGLPAHAAEATVSADGKQLTTAPGQGIDRVTWLIVATPGS